MNTNQNFSGIFEQAIVYPDPEAQERLSHLVGLDETKLKLAKIIGLLVNPARLADWAKKHHPNVSSPLKHVLNRPPLVVLAGDVGSGKSELAETIGDLVARSEKIQVELFPLSLSSRGQGRVGEMTMLLSAAFDQTLERAKKLRGGNGHSSGAVILLVDEADALAQSRENAQMHHEDKAGVNAFIRGIDRIKNAKVPAAVIMCTNRLNALDPAIKRRAAEIFPFSRPSADQRLAVLNGPLGDLGLNEAEIQQIVIISGDTNHNPFGFTYSDLVQRLIPSIILDAYPNRPITGERAIEIAKKISPTPPFKDIKK